jgi:hypothetical protein
MNVLGRDVANVELGAVMLGLGGATAILKSGVAMR